MVFRLGSRSLGANGFYVFGFASRFVRFVDRMTLCLYSLTESYTCSVYTDKTINNSVSNKTNRKPTNGTVEQMDWVALSATIPSWYKTNSL